MSNKALKMYTTAKGSFQLGTAAQEDAGEMLSMLREAAELMVKQGLGQWTPSLFTMELMQQYLEEREVFLLRHEGEAAGMFTLQYGDPSYWGERDDPSFGYLHRLTVRPQFRGLSLGAGMLSFAEEKLRAEGRAGFRLDCVSHLPGLNNFYVGQGFQFVAEQDMGGRIVNLYEKLFV
ncbi:MULTISPECIES: GNAT family N-acetyltransferase [Paenibacillus]|uniref:GNAT family N-acetyltransferase n=1 Tax=Paenibacillus TaxID=44249 RepID=UPI0004915E57|nr:GNAT family N-acetyltransferase [Paenibacillus sp. IHBB 10380]